MTLGFHSDLVSGQGLLWSVPSVLPEKHPPDPPPPLHSRSISRARRAPAALPAKTSWQPPSTPGSGNPSGAARTLECPLVKVYPQNQTSPKRGKLVDPNLREQNKKQ